MTECTRGKSTLAEHIARRINDQSDSLQKAFSDHGDSTRTRHAVIDDLLPRQIAESISDAFKESSSSFLNRDSFRERKRTLAKLDRVDPILANISLAIQESEVVAAVSKVTGFNFLEPDASLYAGGLSIMQKGDFLNPHIDNSHDVDRKRYRRLNLLYYCSDGWEIENGGNLELWDDKVKKPVVLTSSF